MTEMEDLTQRLINALRKAVSNARNADDAAEAAALADFLDAHSTPITVVVTPAPPPETFDNVAHEAAEPFPHPDVKG